MACNEFKHPLVAGEDGSVIRDRLLSIWLQIEGRKLNERQKENLHKHQDVVDQLATDSGRRGHGEHCR